MLKKQLVMVNRVVNIFWQEIECFVFSWKEREMMPEGVVIILSTCIAFYLGNEWCIRRKKLLKRIHACKDQVYNVSYTTRIYKICYHDCARKCNGSKYLNN